MARAREVSADVAEESSNIRFLRVLPGGAQPSTEETATAILLIALLGILWLLRKGFRGGLGAGHVHVGGLDAIIVGIYVMMWTATLRYLGAVYAKRVSGGTATAVAFVTP